MQSAGIQWKRPLSKYDDRFQLVCGSQRNMSFTVPIYNMSVVSVLSYVGQMFELPASLHQRELRNLHKLYRFIPFSLPLAAFAHMREVGLPRAILMKPLSLAMLYRFRHITVPEACQLARIALVGGLIPDEERLASLVPPTRSHVDHPLLHTRGWDTAPVVSNFEIMKNETNMCVSTEFDSQSAAYRFFVQSFYPFSWHDFLVRRLRLTFSVLADFPPSRVGKMLEFALSRFRHLRPVLVSAWLRFALNSLPTSRRLHDGKDSRCPWCGLDDVDCQHILQCNDFEITLSFLELGPMWSRLQQYLDLSSATRLSGEGAIVRGLGLHLPYSVLPFLPPRSSSSACGTESLRSASIRAFEHVCTTLYVKMHAFTGMRRKLCERTGSADFIHDAASTESAIFAALASLT